MAEPEISRRCHFCGASLRVRGMYCPQCGQPTAESAGDSHRERSTETEEVFDPADTVSVDFSALPTADLQSHAAAAETVRLQPLSNENETERDTPALSTSADPLYATTKPLADVTTRDGRMGDARRGFEKVREISNVVLDEASYDPSARFVLVAAVLFVLFLIILILSEMTR